MAFLRSPCTRFTKTIKDACGPAARIVLPHGTNYREYRLAGEGSQNRVKSITQTRDELCGWHIGGLYNKVWGSDSFRRVQETSGTVRFLHETTDALSGLAPSVTESTILETCVSQMTAREACQQHSLELVRRYREQHLGRNAGGDAAAEQDPNPNRRSARRRRLRRRDVYEDHNDDLWIAAANLFRFHNGQATLVRFPGITVSCPQRPPRQSRRALDRNEGRGVFRQSGSKLATTWSRMAW